jgi:hypothetical protein
LTQESKRRKPFTKFDAEASAALARKILDMAGVKGAVIGTINANSYLADDEELDTKDLDLAVLHEDTVWIEKALRDTGIPFERLNIGGVQVEIRRDAIRVDFVDRHNSDQVMGVFREALGTVGDTIEVGGVNLPAVAIEYVVAMKLATARPKDDLIIQALLRDDTIRQRSLDIVARHYGDIGVNRLRALAAAAGTKF